MAEGYVFKKEGIVEMKKIALGATLVWLLCTSLLAFADEWYEGGTLGHVDGHEWLAASEENKLASAGGYLKEKFDNGQLDSDYYSGIDVSSVDDLRPYAESLVSYTEEVVDSAKGGSLSYIDNALDLGLMMMATDMSEAE